MLYENVSSCALNKGFSTGPFSLGRGVRKGDPLLICSVIIDTIQGFTFGEENAKLTYLLTISHVL